MKKNATRLLIFMCVIIISQSLQGCLFEYIHQPKSAQTGQVIDIEISIHDNIVPETNPHKGIFGIIAPDDWTFISATYTSELGNGSLSESFEWKDSVEIYFPNAQFGENMKWFVLLSDQGYTYDQPVSFIVQLKMQVGQTEGCFNLGYLTTKATSGLLSSGNPQWAPLSFPHPIGIPDSNLCVTIFETRSALEWDNLLDRKSGWTGADGIYSIPINESEQPSTNVENKHLILFSDTFIGQVDSLNHRVNASLVNNTLALIPNSAPNEDSIKFFWSEDINNIPQAVFVPETPNANPDDWYWLMDGISIDDKIYVFALRLNSTGGGGAFGFEVNGVALIKFNLDDQSFITNVEQFDTPLFFKNESEGWEIVFGQAIMPMTSASNNPSPDGYIYIYGPKSNISGKELVAARVLPENISDFNLWEYWDGSVWNTSIENCAPITSGISQEFSITPLANNKYLLVSQTGNSVSVKIGESAIGPFGIFNKIYDCPEVLIDPNIFVYNAKAHPSLSTSNELLISYNVNTFDFFQHFSNADIYRPRFIYLKINDSTLNVIETQNIISKYSLELNYPNPFNPSTKINFYIEESGFVSLSVYDLLGNKISEIVKEKLPAGNHTYTFDANELSGRLVSGVYFYTLQTGKYNITKKMIYLK